MVQDAQPDELSNPIRVLISLRMTRMLFNLQVRRVIKRFFGQTIVVRGKIPQLGNSQPYERTIYK